MVKVGGVKRVREILRLWFLVLGLLLVSPGGQSLFSSLSALANPDQSAAAASTDDDDPADDGVVPTDCLFHLCRRELPAPARTVLRQATARLEFNPAAGRCHCAATLALPRVWRFRERAVANPRAPSSRA